MTQRDLILAVDQGTTSSRAIVFDEAANVLSKTAAEIKQAYPRPGWVEQDPMELAETTIGVAQEAVKQATSSSESIAAIGIAVQRETTVAWETRTGTPVSNAIVWQDRRTAQRCGGLIDAGHGSHVWSTTGLVIDPYFSASKIEWMLNNLAVPDIRARAERGEIRVGNVDAWLIDQLCRDVSGGTVGAVAHLTDVSNASRTMLFDIHGLTWDDDLLRLFNIPEACLPDVLPSAGMFTETHPSVFGRPIPITGVAGDQQAATYGQACFNRGDLKCTYGTGAFILASAGGNSQTMFRHTRPSHAFSSEPDSSGLLFTVGWQVGGQRSYASEGSVFATGSTVQWLRDQLGIIDDPADTNDMALLAGDNDGVYFVPAFTGLGSPHWDPNARASITGISRGTGAQHIVRAALESTAYQVHDVVRLIKGHLRVHNRSSDKPMRADGGQSRNPFLMQFQADILGMPIEVPAVDETTALGAAFLAGRGAGIWKSERELSNLRRVAHRYEPDMLESRRATLLAGWNEALRRTKTNAPTS